MYLIIVLDWFTKEIIGYSLSLRSRTNDWLDALEQAVNNRFQQGIREYMKEQLFLISDNGCQPTSQRFMMSCSLLGIKQIFTTWCNPKGNSDTERVLRTIKEDAVWPYDWDNPFELENKLKQWIKEMNPLLGLKPEVSGLWPNLAMASVVLQYTVLSLLHQLCQRSRQN
ncbi:MAG: DDE-type integrase/transposase/recombinase, partial [Candidatus Omnitrophota bacterium]